MIAPGIPINERRRLESLWRLQILDTPAEQRFDRYTRLACKLFDVPIALVSLVDADRQWFKSHIGVNIPEMSRDVSICGHAILEEKPFIVNDTRQDIRFHDNPLVNCKNGIRFYAGAPLVLRDNLNVGTFCLVDTKVRQFNQESIESLEDIAAMVTDELTIFIDELTGLVNRRGFNSALDSLIDSPISEPESVSFIMLDLDQFKNINDQYGHQAGDEALQLFGRMMTRVFRSTDMLSRYGGDEFCVLLRNTNQQEAEQKVVQLRRLIEKYNNENHQPYRIEFSAGVYSSGEQLTRRYIPNIVSKVDKLLYADKKQRNALRS